MKDTVQKLIGYILLWPSLREETTDWERFVLIEIDSILKVSDLISDDKWSTVRCTESITLERVQILLQSTIDNCQSLKVIQYKHY